MLTAFRCLLALLIVGVAAGRASAQTDARAYELKAAFLFQFPQFVEWPASAWEKAPEVRLCVAEPNPFAKELEQLVRGESLRGRPLVVRDVKSVAELDGCHLLFVGSGATGGAPMLRAALGRPILTVGETDTFLASGGIITLKLINNRVRFEVNAEAAQRAGLRMSAQLLALAMAVHRGSL